MQKMNYHAPGIEVVRFEPEEVLNGEIISGTKMGSDVPAVGEIDFIQIP